MVKRHDARYRMAVFGQLDNFTDLYTTDDSPEVGPKLTDAYPPHTRDDKTWVHIRHARVPRRSI